MKIDALQSLMPSLNVFWTLFRVGQKKIVHALLLLFLIMLPVFGYTGADSLSSNPFTKLADLAERPVGFGYETAFSHDSSYLAAAHSGSPYVTIYKSVGDTFSKLPNPVEIPTNHARGVAFSHDSSYLAVAHLDHPYLTIYKRSGDNFSKLPNPAELPSGAGQGVAFSHDSNYLAVAHYDNPYLAIYKKSGDTFSKLPNPAQMPDFHAQSLTFSHDSVYLAVAHGKEPYLTIYKRSGDTFSKLPNPAQLPAGDGYGVAFSHDSNYLAVAHSSPPYLTIYKRSGDTFNKLPNPAELPPDWAAKSVSFSPDSLYLAVGHHYSPFITIYERNGDAFTKLPDPDELPTGFIAEGLAFSPDSYYLAIAHTYIPYLTVYKNTLLPSKDASLTALAVNPGALNPNFARHTTAYLVIVARDVGSIDVIATLSDENAALSINGNLATSNEPKPVTLNGPGIKTFINIVVTAEDGTTHNTYTVTVKRANFSDVPPDHPYFTEIEELVELGITTGYSDGTFRPILPVSRMAMAAFLYRAFGLVDPEVLEPTFTDVPEDHPFFVEIEALAASGITTGWPDGTFRPTLPVTRQAAAAFLFRALSLEDPGVTEPTFSDVPINHTFFTEIEALAAAGITTGWPDGTFRPSLDVTRQAMAAFLIRALGLYNPDDQ